MLTNINLDAFFQAVSRLDSLEPGWHNKVTKPIVMEDTNNCVLGQVFAERDSISGFAFATTSFSTLDRLDDSDYVFSAERYGPLWQNLVSNRKANR